MPLLEEFGQTDERMKIGFIGGSAGRWPASAPPGAAPGDAGQRPALPGLFPEISWAGPPGPDQGSWRNSKPLPSQSTNEATRTGTLPPGSRNSIRWPPSRSMSRCTSSMLSTSRLRPACGNGPSGSSDCGWRMCRASSMAPRLRVVQPGDSNDGTTERRNDVEHFPVKRLRAIHVSNVVNHKRVSAAHGVGSFA